MPPAAATLPQHPILKPEVYLAVFSALISAPPRLIVVPERNNYLVFLILFLPPKRGVASEAFQCSKHLLSLLLERASRRYEFLRPAVRCLRGAVRAARDALGSRNEFSEAFRSWTLL